MLKLGKFLSQVAAIVSGLGLLLYTLPWLHSRQNATALPAGVETAWLACAACLGLSLLASRWLGKRQQARNQEELESARREHVFVAQGSPWWFLLVIPLTVGFGAMGYAAARKGQWGMSALGLGLLLLFLLLGYELARQFLRPGPMLQMDSRGIRHAIYGSIPWADVVGLQLHSMKVRYSTSHTLFLCVREPLRYLNNAPPFFRWIQGRRLRSNPGYGSLPVPLNILNKDPELIHRSALALRRSHNAPLLKHWHHRMEADEVSTWLRMQEMNEEAERITEEMRATPIDPSPEQMRAFEARMRQHAALNDALRPQLEATLEKSAKRTRKDLRTFRIVGWTIVGMWLLWLALKFLR
ncbi:hypothetical protein J5837_07470 [Pseudoxanthomonas helianthi]|uniref:Uncharacterized protein n=1 Tax=Pseudoxanthomonas helianthi TaxID=1453541 RepID=A0A940X449_9GAMM|nr:hypothetical protein [Pseudoxanthomonas helianthi]MBP3984265.1 hypothetical protein [Pseudoxanthomonas helianthi]